MADINFVADPGKQNPKKSDSPQDQINWSKAEQAEKKSGLLSFLKGDTAAAPSSRDEALQMIKSYVKDKEGPVPVASTASAVDDVPAKPAKPVGRILEMKPHDESGLFPSSIGRTETDLEQSRDKMAEFTGFFKKFFTKKPRAAGNGHILATDLISSEVRMVFDWRKNLPVFIFWLILSGLILAGAYQGLIVWEEKKIAEANTNTEKFGDLRIKIAQEERGVDEILDLQKKLELIKKLLDRHIYWSSFFAFLERNTLADVAFNSFGGDTKGLYSLSGTAKDFKTLADQLTTFKADNMVTWVGSRGGAASIDKLGNGLISFSLELWVKKGLFNKEGVQTKQ